MAILVSPSGFATRRRRSTRQLHPLLLDNDAKRGPATRSKANATFDTTPVVIEGKRRRSSRLTGYASPPLSASSSPESYRQLDKEDGQKEYENLKILLKISKKKKDEPNPRKELKGRKKRKIEQVVNAGDDGITDSTCFRQQDYLKLSEAQTYESKIGEEAKEFKPIEDQNNIDHDYISNPLDENMDYITLSSTLNLLYSQRDKIQNDILQLNRLKRKFNDDPSELINLLNNNNNNNLLPTRDKIIKCPMINLSKYGILDNEDPYILSVINNYPLFQSTNLFR